MMRQILGTVVLLTALMLSASPARADATTPFVEGASVDVGTVSEGHGYVLAGESDDGPVFLVMVSSDTGVNVTILATAEKGVVPANLIGRPAIIKAEIVQSPGVKRSNSGAGMLLKILAVRSSSNAAAPAEKPAVTRPAGAAITQPAGAAVTQAAGAVTGGTAMTQPAGMPRAGLKILLQERDAAGKAVGKEEADQITYVDGAITTLGLAASGMPAVKVSVSPGNATDFYSGTATSKDGTAVTWAWGVVQMSKRAIPFEASITVVAKDGKKHQWEVRQAGE